MSSRFRGVRVARRMLFVAALTGFARIELAADEPPLPRQIVVRVSGEYLAPLIERPIDELLPVDEVILGVRALGEAQVAAQPRLIVADDPHRAAFTVTLAGTIHSRTVGRKGPVQIHNRSETRFTGKKRVVFLPGRGFVGEPAQIETETSSQTERIVPDRGGILGRAIEWRAWTRVDQSRERVEQIVRAKIEDRIQETFERLLAGRLARINWLAEQRLLLAAALAAGGEPAYTCSTSGGYLQIAAASHLCKPSLCLPFAGGPPVQVWIHENVVGERAANWLQLFDVGRRSLRSERSPTLYDLRAAGDWLVFHFGHWPHPAETLPADPKRVADLRTKDSQAE